LEGAVLLAGKVSAPSLIRKLLWFLRTAITCFSGNPSVPYERMAPVSRAIRKLDSATTSGLRFGDNFLFADKP